MSLTERWNARLDAVREAGRWRAARAIEPTGPVTARVDGDDLIVACSNDYLGLAWDASSGGRAAGSSRLVSGSRPVHRALERALGEWFGGEAVLFSTGWHANVSVLATLPEASDLVASDARNHASIIDGLRLSAARRIVVPHAAPEAVPEDARWLVLEGLYSMDGDVPPFGAYRPGPALVVDEAHAVGCLGPGGRGAASAAGFRPDVMVGTFGKAFGAFGAFAIGPPPFRALIENLARAWIFTTAPPEDATARALAHFRRVVDDDALRARLAEVALRLRTGLRQEGFTVRGEHHVLGVMLGDRAGDVAARLRRAGVWAPPIRWPTVPKGEERIRLGASAAMSDELVDRIVTAFGKPPPG